MDCQEIYNEVKRQPGFNVVKEPLHVWPFFIFFNKFPFEFDVHYIIKARNKNETPSYLLTKVNLVIARLIPIRIIITSNGPPGLKVVNERKLVPV